MCTLRTPHPLCFGNAGSNVLYEFKRWILYSMDTRYLESFVIVAEKGSIAEAARRLNLTPAAVAQSLELWSRQLAMPW